jgi:hypothetical protein
VAPIRTCDKANVDTAVQTMGFKLKGSTRQAFPLNSTDVAVELSQDVVPQTDGWVAALPLGTLKVKCQNAQVTMLTADIPDDQTPKAPNGSPTAPSRGGSGGPPATSG